MKERLLKLGLVGAMALGIPAAAAAHGSGDSSKGLDVAAQHSNGNSPTTAGDPANKPTEDTGKPDTAGSRPHNHGWFVSQAAKNSSLKAAGTNGTSTHGAAVSAVAKSDQGK